MSPLIDDLNKSIDIGSSVIVSPEQAPSFEYYSKEIFGQKIENNKECDLKTLDLVNYYILDKAVILNILINRYLKLLKKFNICDWN